MPVPCPEFCPTLLPCSSPFDFNSLQSCGRRDKSLPCATPVSLSVSLFFHLWWPYATRIGIRDDLSGPDVDFCDDPIKRS